jgi:hypothetical protein
MNTTQPTTRIKTCCNCSQEYQAKRHDQRFCADCIEANKAARHTKTTQPTEKRQRKHRACNSAHPYSKLLYYLDFLLERDGDYRNLHWQCSAANGFIKAQSKAQRTPLGTLESAVIVYCRLNGLLPHEAWEDMMYRLRRDTPEWHAEIDQLFLKAMGRNPDRTNSRTIKDEGLDMWDRVKLPYTHEQMQWLFNAFEHYRKNFRNFSYAEKQRFYYQPPKFEEEEKPKVENKPEEKPSEDTSSFLAALLLAFLGGRGGDDERYGGRYGYLSGTRPHMSKPLEKEGDPEQDAHEDQDAIDAAAAELLDSIDWGS